MKQQRMTFDMSPEDHKRIKLFCVKIGVSIKDFIVKSALENIKKYEQGTNPIMLDKNDHKIEF